jgi:hypothetical protein
MYKCIKVTTTTYSGEKSSYNKYGDDARWEKDKGTWRREDKEI